MIATKKGVNILERGSQVHFMAEVQELLDFPPAPKLGDRRPAAPRSARRDDEKRGEALFFGKAQVRASATRRPTTPTTRCTTCARSASTSRARSAAWHGRADGPIKTFPLRGIKDSPPYLHDGRLLTLDDTIEFFNLILETRLTDAEKRDLLAFLYTL